MAVGAVWPPSRGSVPPIRALISNPRNARVSTPYQYPNPYPPPVPLTRTLPTTFPRPPPNPLSMRPWMARPPATSRPLTSLRPPNFFFPERGGGYGDRGTPLRPIPCTRTPIRSRYSEGVLARVFGRGTGIKARNTFLWPQSRHNYRGIMGDSPSPGLSPCARVLGATRVTPEPNPP